MVGEVAVYGSGFRVAVEKLTLTLTQDRLE